MGLEVFAGILKTGQNFCAVSDHPWAAVFKRNRRKGNHEFAEIVASIENLHTGSYARFAIIHKDNVCITNILEIKLNNLIG
jgi:hypothetical protein